MSLDKAYYTRFIREKANELGFMYCGISKAEKLDDEARFLENWLNQQKHGEMSWMANHFDKRVDPTLLVPGAKSVVSLAYNYFPESTQEDSEAPKISRYAYGRDYHKVLKKKLKTLLEELVSECGELAGRCFVDSAPVMDKAWAKRGGVGWIGKHTNLVNPKAGSYFFLAELIIDLELEYDGPIKDYCGTCTRCVEACPTDAITEPYVVDGSKCISYFTIELKGSIPDEQSGKFNNWAFGCDICQEVCPWNRFSKPHNEPDFNPHPDLLTMSKSDWEDLSEEVFQEIFRQSAVKRTKYDGLKRNLKFLGIDGD
ncbi:tRNA epoxyqueuosine(34) reductase QueG [bacterium SCSIO 12741]|nr:tRNA epoxyqueuosine(34) reductase QueG [bacterium SCSIO 12741]